MTNDPDLVAERDALLSGLGDRPPWYRPFRRRLWDQRRRAILAMDVSVFGRMLRETFDAATVDRVARMSHSAFRSMTKEPRSRAADLHSVADFVPETADRRVSRLSTPVLRRDGDWVQYVYPVTKDDLP